MHTSEQINDISTALVAIQAEIENASKNAANPHFRSKYADLAEVLNTVRPVFAKHGVAVVQSPSYCDGQVAVTTTLMHTSGQWIMGTISAPISKADAQGVGSAITYCRRYSLAAFAGIAQEDDDGNAAAISTKEQKSHFKHDSVLVKAFETAKTLDEVKEAWSAVNVSLRHEYAQYKDAAKTRIGGGNA
ncbi:MAG: ERF family protein [Plesiomonas shigelloides]